MAFYLPIITGPYETKNPTTWLSEAPLTGLTRAAIIKDILDGQIEDVERVLEIDEAAGTVKIVTTEIANDVCDATWGDAQEPFASLRTWLDRHADGVGYYVEPRKRYGER